MKKILKYGILVIISILVLVILTGCGKNTIIATKSDSDNTFGEYSQKVEITFAGDAISRIYFTMTFKDESIVNFIEESLKEEGFNFTKEGNTLYLELNTEEYKKMSNQDYNTMSKEEIKESFTKEGYTVEEK